MSGDPSGGTPAVPETSPDVRAALTDGICAVTLARAARHNALSARMRADLVSLVTWASAEPAVRALTLHGDGPSFCAGNDLKEAQERRGPRADTWSRTRDNLASVLADCGVPTVAGLHGNVLGRGLDLALAADLRVASEDAVFGLPEIEHGMVVGGGGARRLARIVGEGRAMEMVLCGRQLDARTALDWGLVTSVVPPTELHDTTRRLATALTRRSDLALYAARTAVRTAFDTSVELGGWTDTLVNVLKRRGDPL